MTDLNSAFTMVIFLMFSALLTTCVDLDKKLANLTK